jgi:isoleucyl-tRNA synthetase
MAPVLSFTCEEAWRLYRPDAEPSVHLTLFPQSFDDFRDDALALKWETIRNVRRVVTGALEVERAAKRIGSSLEASPLVYVSDSKIFSTLFDIDLAEVCITSNYEVEKGEGPADAFRLDNVPGVAVVVEKAVGTKCARSWKILPTVGDDPEYPDVSPRDAQALREWNALGEASAMPRVPVSAPLRVVEAVSVVLEISGQHDVETPAEKKSAKKSGTTEGKKASTKKKAAKKAAKKPARKAGKKASKKAAAAKGAKKKAAKKKTAKKVTRKAARKAIKKPAKKVSATKAKKKKNKARKNKAR